MRELGVEHGVLGFLDRELGVLVGRFGGALRLLHVVFGSILLERLADRLHLLVPIVLQLVPPRGDLALAFLGVLAQRVGLGLRGVAGGLHVLFELGLLLGFRGGSRIFELLRSRG